MELIIPYHYPYLSEIEFTSIEEKKKDSNPNHTPATRNEVKMYVQW